MPRIGIAWRPFGEKTVIRSGFGWFYNVNHTNTFTVFNLMPPKSGSDLFQTFTNVEQNIPVTGADGVTRNVQTRVFRPDRRQSGRRGQPAEFFDPLAFQRVTCNIPSRPDLCHLGSARNDILGSPSQENVDFSMYKNFQVTERIRVQFRSEFFNLFNTPYFGQPNNIGFSSQNVIVPDAARQGEIRSTRTPQRIIQFGLKLFF